MLRIGLAASKIAKGNLWVYHLAVVVIACLVAMFVFLICGFCIIATLFLLSVLIQHFWPSASQEVWVDVYKTCLIFLGILIGILAVIAIIKNIKLTFKP